MRIVRLANFITPTSGGLRTALRELGRGYAAAGHEPVLVMPGAIHDTANTDEGLVITLPGPTVPGTGGYRILWNADLVARTLSALRPDRLEVSDRSTLRWTGGWARRHDVRSVMVSHESVEGLLKTIHLPALGRKRLAIRLNRATAFNYDRVICTTGWAEHEFDATGAHNVRRVPLGVDLHTFHPDHRSERLRAALAAPDEVLLLCCTRLSVEKRPQRALDTLTALLEAGIKARLIVAGDGPLRRRLQVRAAGLPATFIGFVSERNTLAELLATADIVLAPGPIETFGLAALESLASGTPVVVSASSALPAVVGSAGVSVVGENFEPGVRKLLAMPEAKRRLAARRRAEEFSWDAAVHGFLDVHESLT